MAHIRKTKSGTWEIIYYHPTLGRKSLCLPKDTPEEIVHAKRDKIRLAIREHKLGLKQFALPGAERTDYITLEQFREKFLADKTRRIEVSELTYKRNIYALDVLISVYGKDMPVKNISQYIDQFKTKRYQNTVERISRQGREVDEHRIKRGINRDLANLSAVFNYASTVGIISEKIKPSFPPFRKVRAPEVEILETTEIMRWADALKKINEEAWLAFMIIRYTGSRRGGVAKYRKYSDHGLKWGDIDWMRKTITFKDKGKIKKVPMVDELRNVLIDWKNKYGLKEPKEHVISLTRETITHYFKKAMRNAGIDKNGSVHILRHTAATKLVEAGFGVPDLMEWFGWSSPEIAMRYVHIAHERLQKLAKKAAL